MPRTLVTGGAGFLGSHLCESLLKRGHDVIAMDNLLTGNIANLEHLHEERFKFIKHDVTAYLYVAGKIDYVLHLASPASPADYLQWPIQTLRVGALGTHNALGLAKEKGATFLLASTSEVYGDPLVHPQKEDYWGNVNPIGLRGVYDEAKRFISRAQELLGWKPRVDLETGLGKTIAWFRKQLRLRQSTKSRNIETRVPIQLQEELPSVWPNHRREVFANLEPVF
jgi:nucleoside-diphosphate-sugar epimerase